MITSEDLSDNEWRVLIVSLKRDFARLGKEKSAMLRSFEKYFVFQNKFVALADLCAEMHESIVDAEPGQLTLPKATSSARAMRKYYSQLRGVGKRANALYGHCVILRLLTPIMAEAFLNMLIVTFCKAAIRNDRQAYADFVRAKIPARIDLLSQNCDGFSRQLTRPPMLMQHSPA
jgi:hypothetical protein